MEMLSIDKFSFKQEGKFVIGLLLIANLFKFFSVQILIGISFILLSATKSTRKFLNLLMFSDKLIKEFSLKFIRSIFLN